MKKETFMINVDFSLPLAQMIKEGEYNWIHKDITQENFPIQDQGKKQFNTKLFHFKCLIESDEVNKKMNKANFRPAILPELLALGAQYPELLRQFPILALGSLWLGYVPVIGSGSSGRALSLRLFEEEWMPYCRFAAVSISKRRLVRV
ncbi:MAG: hypothetical protein PHE77_01685 [Candidatus Pacebacteria bacterium]|nr:hypothetical protein [Candidatus Paceibacterota bacterium]